MTDALRTSEEDGFRATPNLAAGQLAAVLCGQILSLEDDEERRYAVRRVFGLLAGLAGPERELDGGTGRSAAPLEKVRWAADCGIAPGVQHLNVAIEPGSVKVANTVSATGRALLSNGYLGADLLHVPHGDAFPPHTHAGDHLLFVLAGRGTITIAGEIVPTAPGEAFMVEGAVPHAVGAIDDHVLLSVGAPHHPVDSPARQAVVGEDALLALDGSIGCVICGLTAADRAALAALGCSHAGRHA